MEVKARNYNDEFIELKVDETETRISTLKEAIDTMDNFYEAVSDLQFFIDALTKKQK